MQLSQPATMQFWTTFIKATHYIVTCKAPCNIIKHNIKLTEVLVCTWGYFITLLKYVGCKLSLLCIHSHFFLAFSTVSCFFINCQGPVVPRAPCQMDRDAIPAPLLGTESLTPVTQGTWGLQVVLVERVSQMACGQGVIQRVHVSPHYVISYPLHTDYKHAKELLVFLVYTTIQSISKNLMFPSV